MRTRWGKTEESLDFLVCFQFFPVEFKVELSWTILNWLFLLDFWSKTKRKLFHKGMSWQVQAGTKDSFPFWTLGVHLGFMVWSNSVYLGPFSFHPTVNVTGNHRIIEIVVKEGGRQRNATVWLAACLSMQWDLEPLVPVTSCDLGHVVTASRSSAHPERWTAEVDPFERWNARKKNGRLKRTAAQPLTSQLFSLMLCDKGQKPCRIGAIQ